MKRGRKTGKASCGIDWRYASKIEVEEWVKLRIQINRIEIYSLITGAMQLGAILGRPDRRVEFMLDTKEYLEQIPSIERQILLLHHGQGFTLEECGEILHIQKWTISRKLSKAYDILRALDIPEKESAARLFMTGGSE